MSTLFDRLKPEYKEALMDNKKEHPYTTEEIVRELKQKEIVGRLEYCTVISLQLITEEYELSPFEFFKELY